MLRHAFHKAALMLAITAAATSSFAQTQRPSANAARPAPAVSNWPNKPVKIMVGFPGGSTPDLVAWTGALTALFAGLIAFSQNDIKKVLAYSTMSQLAYMFFALGIGAGVAAIFHLVIPLKKPWLTR